MKLTRMERELIDILLVAETPISASGLVERCYAAIDSMADNNVIRVRIHGVNRKMQQHNIKIDNRFNEGYYIADSDKARLHELLEAPKKICPEFQRG